MPKKRSNLRTTSHLAKTLAGVRAASQLSQSEVAKRMGTSQTAIARLEAGRQSPSVSTLQDFARANGFCLEIGFVPARDQQTGCILILHGPPEAATNRK